MLKATNSIDKMIDPSDTPSANTRTAPSWPHLLPFVADQSRFGSRLQFARLPTHHRVVLIIPRPYHASHVSSDCR
jgi:hypothetical protein